MEFCVESSGEDETMMLGEKIGRLLKGSEIIVLASDLGGGKTTLTKGLAKGMGVSETVSSPTFNISRVYKTEDLELHHYDFYRLGEMGLMDQDLHEAIDDGRCVVVIEWADIARDGLDPERLIEIQINNMQDNETHRRIEIAVPDRFEPWQKELELSVC